MTMTELHALLPIIVIAGISVVLMVMTAFFRHQRLASLITYGGFIAAAVLVAGQTGSGPQQATPLLIMDEYSRFFSLVILVTSLAATMLAYDYLRRSDVFKEEYYILLSLAVLGAVVLVSSNHFAAFFIGIELMSVSLFAMVGYMVQGRTRRAVTLEASVKYMILSGVSSSFLLFGIALVYADFGVLSFSGLHSLLGLHSTSSYSQIGAAMIVVGLAFKLSWVPFHMWTPDVYEGAPVPVTAFLATVSKVSVFAIIVRFFIESGAFRLEALVQALVWIAVLSMLVGNGLALLQQNIKRLLAYSSIAHLGYLMVAFIAIAGSNLANTNLAVEATAFYLVAYIVMSLIAFGIITTLSSPERAEEAETLAHFRGLFWQKPGLATAMGLALLSLAGIPLTIGFVGKFYVFAAGVAGQLWLLVGVLIVGSALGLYYYLRLIMEMCKAPDTEPAISREETPLENRVVLSALGLVLLVIGIFPNGLITTVHAAVAVLR